MRWSLLLPLAALVCSAQAPAEDPAPAKQPTKVVDPNKKICRRIDMTGSMVPRRECHTAAEWSAIDQQNGRAASGYLDGRRSGTGDH